MKKLRLELDDLRIDSFSTTPAQTPNGTVFGEQCTCYTNCTCPGCPTCDASCNGTCDASCNCPTDTADYSCGGTCEASCGNMSCDYTCDGYMTYANGQQACVAC